MCSSVLCNVILVCPTSNPGKFFDDWLEGYFLQMQRPEQALIIDSSSSDDTVKKTLRKGLDVEVILKEEFNHGATRNKVLEYSERFEFVVFLTQDAILSERFSIKKILLPFEDDNVAAVCGRQLPKPNAKPIEAHARLYNYGVSTVENTKSDIKTRGLKTAFLSNSFSAYRVSTLQNIGGFPESVIFGEDMYVAAKLLKAGYKLVYAADACVYHSHDYSLMQEMRRYFDMGVFHAREPWIRKDLGGAEGEGVKFVVSEYKYLLKHAFWLIPEGVLRTLFRYTGFRLGLMERWIPLWLKRLIAMNKGYFKQ